MKPFIVLLTLTLSMISTASCDDADSPDPVVIEKLEEIVKIRRAIAETAKLEIELGTENPNTEAVFELAEAKLALASEKREQTAILTELEFIVRLRKQEFDREKRLAEEARRTQSELGTIKVKLLEAEIRLHRAKTKYGKK